MPEQPTEGFVKAPSNGGHPLRRTSNGIKTMIKKIALATALLLAPAAAMAQNQGQPNGLPEASAMKFRTYVIEQRPTSFSYSQPVAVGTVLPADGVTYYNVPAEYGMTGYRYTVVNNQPVIVEPSSRRIIQVIR